jgi:hypothetical protein
VLFAAWPASIRYQAETLGRAELTAMVQADELVNICWHEPE